MALSEKHIDEIVALYDEGNGDSITDIAQSYPNATPAMIKFHLRARNVLVADGRTKAARAEAKPEAVDDLVGEDDAALGIGEPEDGDDADLDTLMANPKLAAMIEAAVAKRLQDAGVSRPALPQSGSEAAFDAFLSKFDHMLEVQAEQRPGYIKPLSADEIDSRRKGRVDMFALLRDYKLRNVWPQYLLGDEANPFYGPSPNGDILYDAGQEIYTRLPPAEGFKPMNDEAVAVCEAYRRWVGDPIPVEELIAQAAATARGGSPSPEIAAVDVRTPDPEVRLVEGKTRDVSPKRVLGTTAPELRGRPMPKQPGIAGQPVGPTFVSDSV